ncbi:hypothetical protein C8R45DRAFT_1017633 [Mycena sanguinolenta]|nr:hypothetical protein C8R45DRAFT_1017633 [Mycena sanguinolenta]
MKTASCVCFPLLSFSPSLPFFGFLFICWVAAELTNSNATRCPFAFHSDFCFVRRHAFCLGQTSALFWRRVLSPLLLAPGGSESLVVMGGIQAVTSCVSFPFAFFS